MSKKKIDIEINVDNSDVEESKEAFDDVSSSTGAFGAGLAALKGGFAALKKGLGAARLGFTGLKGAIAATGIGLLLLAFASLVSFFTKTKRGAELLEVATASLGAAFDQIVDVSSALGDALTKVFKGDFKGAIDTVSDSVEGLGDKMVAAATAAKDLTLRQQELTDNERAFRVEQAGFMDVIDRLKQQSDDQTLSEEVRISKLREAAKFEKDLADKRLQYATEQADIIRAQNEIAESTAEDLDRLADAEVAYREAQVASAKVATELAIKEKAIIQGGADQRKAANDKILANNIKAAEASIALTQETESIVVAMMKDGTEKKIALINLESKKKIDAIKGNSEEETALRIALEEQAVLEIAKVREQADRDRLKVEEETQKQITALRLSLMAEGVASEIAQIESDEIAKRTAILEQTGITEQERSFLIEQNREQTANKIKAIEDRELQNSTAQAQKQVQLAAQAQAAIFDIMNQYAAYQKQLSDTKTDDIDASANHDINVARDTAIAKGWTAEQLDDYERGILAAASKDKDAIAKKEFERQQKLAYVQAVISANLGSVQTFTSMLSSTGNFYIAGAAAVVALGTGLATALAIKKQKYKSSGSASLSAKPNFNIAGGGGDGGGAGGAGGVDGFSSPTASPVGTQTTLSAVDGAGTETLGAGGAGSNQSIRVHVLERDITNTQGVIASIEDTATIG